MACPICGQPSPCAHEHKSTIQTAGAESLGGQASAAVREYAPASLTISVARSEGLGQAEEHDQPEETGGADEKFWREEVVSRVQQHRARRRRRHDSQESLQLDFQEGIESPSIPRQEKPIVPLRRKVRPELPKIIQFPRSAVPKIRAEESQDLELAEPVVETPRILDAPEPPPQQMDFLAAFADIQLEAAAGPQTTNLELPLQTASIGYRLFAGLIDLVVVLMAGALFAIGFIMSAGKLPQPRQGLLCGLIVAGSLWLIYQYLFLVYSPGTPGMQLSQLELCTFKGEPVSVSLRRGRAFASVLSALTLGLGFAWALVDEDSLGWHDRMTQTHLKHSTHEESGDRRDRVTG